MGNDYKSPYRLSQEWNISSTAIYKKLKLLDNELKPHIKKENNKILLNAEAERILKESFSDVLQPVLQPIVEPLENQLDNQFDKLYNKFDSEIEFLREQTRLLQEQNKSLQDELIKEREYSRTQTDRLADQSDRITNLAEQLAELNRNNQLLLGAEQSRTNPALLMNGNEQNNSDGTTATEDTAKKSSIFSKLFRKK